MGVMHCQEDTFGALQERRMTWRGMVRQECLQPPLFLMSLLLVGSSRWGPCVCDTCMDAAQLNVQSMLHWCWVLGLAGSSVQNQMMFCDVVEMGQQGCDYGKDCRGNESEASILFCIQLYSLYY